MYPPETHAKFVELRAKGYSQCKAAEELGIHRSTALEWDHQYRSEIQNLRHYEMEALQEKLLPTDAEEIALLMEEFNSVNAALKKRDYTYYRVSTSQLWNRQNQVLARLDKLRLKYRPVPPPQTPKTQKTQ